MLMWMGQGTENCNEDPKDGFGFVVLSIVYVLAYVNYLYLINKILHAVGILVSPFDMRFRGSPRFARILQLSNVSTPRTFGMLCLKL
jgi:hypothetical protein